MPSVWSKIIGTIETAFQLGLGGPQLRNNAGNIEARNSTDTAFTILRGADPVNNNDLVTLQYGNSHFSGGGSSGIATLDFGAFPGATDTSLAITGQSGITPSSVIQVNVNGSATVDHSADEQLVEGVRLTASNIIAGTGFTISAQSLDNRQYGLWSVAWSWR